MTLNAANSFLGHALVQMVAADGDLTPGTSPRGRGERAGVGGEVRSGEDVLPAPCAVSIRIFFPDGRGKVDRAITGRQVEAVQLGDAAQVLPKRRDEALGKHRHVVGFSLLVAHGDLAEVEVHVSDAQAQSFDQAQAGAVEQLDDEVADAGEGREHLLDFFPGEDGGR